MLIDDDTHNFSDVKYTTSMRGQPVLEVGPYRYNKRSGHHGPACTWLCVKWSSRWNCRASVFTFKGEVIRFKGEHNH